ncbi:MAG: hypothetical protein JWR75_63 [Devosia sp.]|nr:hypothetical protein [Devosia sp.]
MRIDIANRVNTSAARPTGARNGAGAVFEPNMGTTTRAAATAAAGPMQDIGSLLALQSVEDPTQPKKKAIRRARNLLDALDAVKGDMLVGQINEGRLNSILSVISQRREKSEPGLDDLLNDIELRARVELAKFGRFPAF